MFSKLLFLIAGTAHIIIGRYTENIQNTILGATCLIMVFLVEIKEAIKEKK